MDTRELRFAVVCLGLCGVVNSACSSGLPDDTDAKGGAAGRGGSSNTGPASGGIPQGKGGAITTIANGGTLGQGGTAVPATGGRSGSGGLTAATGGAVSALGGAVTSVGGTSGKAGASASSGGTTSIAGARNNGGVAGSYAGVTGVAGRSAAGAAGATVCSGATGGKVVALFHFDGTNGSTVFQDSSGLNKMATPYGNAQLSSAQSVFGGSSLYVNGTSKTRTNYVTIAGGEDFTLAGDYTIDYWQYVVSYTNTWGAVLAVANSPSDPLAPAVCWNQGGARLHFNPYYYSGGVATAPTNNAWHHLALTRSGTTFRAFIDGTMVYQTANSTGTMGALTAWVSGIGTGSDNGDYNGYIDELRIVKGAALWTTDFTAPTAPADCSSTSVGQGGAGGTAGSSGMAAAGGGTSSNGGITSTTGGGVGVGGAISSGGSLASGGAAGAGGGGSTIATGCGALTGTVYFCDDFESGVSKWKVATLGWNTTNLTYQSPGNSITDSPDGNYAQGAANEITLAASVDLPAVSMPVLTFWHRLDLACSTTVYASCCTSTSVCPNVCSNGSCSDFGYVEISTDSGTTWSQILTLTSTSNTSVWSFQQLSLATYAGKKIKIRFRLWDKDDGFQSDGWYLDDIVIQEAN